MADYTSGTPNDTSTFGGAPLTPTPPPAGFTPTLPGAAPQYTDTFLLDIFERYRKESMQFRWVWEREWLRDLFYVANRQWITYHPTRREWIDKRLSKWVPRPVTNKIAEILQAIRTNFAAINLSVSARPLGSDTQSIAAAEVTDEMAPLIHEEHQMDSVMREADFWFIATGNACLHVGWDRDKRFNRVFIPHETCVACRNTFSPQAIVNAGQKCPQCGATQFKPATNPDGSPLGDQMAFGRGKTSALSPFEYAFPVSHTRWDELPYVIRLRWRDKHWFEANMPSLVSQIVWEKSPTDRSLQIFKSLALQNDVGTGTNFSYLATAGQDTTEGVTEYELWIRPNTDFPDGYVMRVIGDKGPIILHREQEEAIPGPLPYKDIEGTPLFPFMHAQYEHMGGRLYGRSALSPLIQKQDQLNQLDSLVQLMLQRTANPVWVVPEGAGVEHFTGEPGLILKWNPLAANGQAKPERVAGSDVPGSLFELRAQILKDMEELSGAFDIIKGQKPSGVEAFSALQLLVERSQSRFTSAFQARGEMYRQWFAVAIELERQFGPVQRTRTVVANNKGYTFQHFENAQLQGQMSIVIEDGSQTPKTSLGKRAAIEQANNLQLLDPHDPEQRMALLTTFGLSDIAPSLNYHINASATLQDAFENWAKNPVGPSPLVVKPWFDPKIHWTERVKWLNTDKMRELMKDIPELEPLIMQHLQELQALLQPPPAPAKPPSVTYSFKGPDLIDPQVREVFDKAEGLQPPPQPTAPGLMQPMVQHGMMRPAGAPQPQGSGMAMKNSNQNSTSTNIVPHGNAPGGPQMGPV